MQTLSVSKLWKLSTSKSVLSQSCLCGGELPATWCAHREAEGLLSRDIVEIYDSDGYLDRLAPEPSHLALIILKSP